MNKNLIAVLTGITFFAFASTSSAFADTTIHTGDADSDVSISNKAGMNVANVSTSNGGNANIVISGNGAFSDNVVRYTNDNGININQNNYTDISNNVNISNNTGGNSVKSNTSYTPWHKGSNDGDVMIHTGDTTANVNIHNEAGLNMANVSGCNDCGGTNIKIQGNGAHSDNIVSYESDNDVDLDQYNDTHIDNDVNIHNNTGNNSANGYDKHHEEYKHDGYKKPEYDNKFSKKHDEPVYKNYGDKYPYLKHHKDDNYDKDQRYDKKDHNDYPKYLKSDYGHKDYDKKNEYCYPYKRLDYHKDYKSDKCDYDKEYYPKKHADYKPVYKDYNHYKKEYDKYNKYHDYPKYKDYDYKKLSKYDNKCGNDKYSKYQPQSKYSFVPSRYW